jgi:predicted NUDIX family NTP pyrophosphohydrolase
MKRSAGIVLYKIRDGELRVLLVHPGGPFWARKDAATWSIPKGECDKGEDPLRAAIREFSEETGMIPKGEFYPLGEIEQSNRKTISAWACEGDLDVAKFVSNCCEIEWPPKSGERLTIPEMDRAEWFPINEARVKLTPAQLPFLERLEAHLTTQEISG